MPENRTLRRMKAAGAEPVRADKDDDHDSEHGEEEPVKELSA